MQAHAGLLKRWAVEGKEHDVVDVLERLMPQADTAGLLSLLRDKLPALKEAYFSVLSYDGLEGSDGAGPVLSRRLSLLVRQDADK